MSRKTLKHHRALNYLQAVILVVVIVLLIWLPDHHPTIWVTYITVQAAQFYWEMRDPINYWSLTFTEDAIHYAVFEGHSVLIPYADIESIRFVRADADLYSGSETMWLVRLRTGKGVQIEDEWQDRRRLRRELRAHLPTFDMEIALAGRRSRQHGEWICFTHSPA